MVNQRFMANTRITRITLMVIGVLLAGHGAMPRLCLGDEVKCTGKYKGGLKPSPAQLAEILKQHAAWLKDGGPLNAKLGDDSRKANPCGADLAYAHLDRADLRAADLTVADLSGAHLEEVDLDGADLDRSDLSGADLKSAQVTKARLAYVTLTDAIYAPASEPPDAYVAGIKGLTTIKAATGEHIGLIQLRKLLQDAGLRDGAREATFSIQRNITKDQLTSRFPSPAWFAGIIRTVGLGWTTAYGLHPERALRWILLLGMIVTPVYMLAALRPTGESGIIKVFPAGRLDGTAGDLAGEEKPKKQLVHAKGWRCAFPTATYFALISAVNIGFEQFTPGDWIRRLQTREYSLEAVGWVRVVAGAQALLSVYLLAMWVLTQFGQPFE